MATNIMLVGLLTGSICLFPVFSLKKIQSTGINVLLRYTPEILRQVGVVSLFSDIGLSPHSTSILISALNALLMLPCITAAMLLMDVCGRR
jgi:hypothetical protein